MSRLKTFGQRLKTFDTRTARPPEKKADSIYTTQEWRNLMKEIFKERGRRCEDPECKTPNGPWKALYGDHIKEIKHGGAELDKSNVLIRCGPCHGVKTTAERIKWGETDYGSA